MRKAVAETVVSDNDKKQSGGKNSQKDRKKIWLLLALVILCAIGIGYYIYSNYKTYDTYSIENELKMQDTVESSYDMFKERVIKYSKDGITLLDEKGEGSWSQSYSMKSPRIVKNQNYLVSADIGGNSVYLFNESGKVEEYTMPYPICDVEVSEQGVIAVVLEDDKANYIQLYDKEGKQIVDSTMTIAQSGYPLDIALSKDAMCMVVSYVTIDGMDAKNTIAFYNFGSVGQNANSNKYVGGFYYTDTIFPKVEFLDDTTVCAYGDNKAVLYYVKEKPSDNTTEIPFDTQIRSVFSNEKYIGFIRKNEKQPEKGKYIVDIYNTKGSSVLRKMVDIDYEKVKFHGNDIILIGEYDCTILRLKGNEKFHGRFDNGVTDMIPLKNQREYLVIGNKSIMTIKIK